ncbi:putative transmembrane protein [Tupanvirus soda lake]|uniref:Transmembrane protein n=2 Tax=Tupanvirus TaxID=2094720 RepID=A0AC62AAB0_9VIRU|nr:putative transmembrane protein [Tupanvirus soda lake]QKU34674.1 putative transmembrane protein [Tupanvirus soda lake]
MFDLFFNYLLYIFFAYILADLLTGIFHWFKDTYFGPFTPIIGKTLIWGSRLHHIRPRYVIEFTDWDLFWSSAKWTLIWMGPLFCFTGFTVFMVTLFLMIALNDVIHKYAHMVDNERPAWASFMQKIYIFQSHDEHHLHHIVPHEINYCPITPYVNIILEKFNVWRRTENIIEKYLGIKPRNKEYDFVEDIHYPAGIKFLP